MKIKCNGIKNLDSRSKRGFRASIEKNPIASCRIRKITGSFAFIEHRFLREGFWASLDHHQLLLYLFLIIVADRHGLSYYNYDKICTLLRICVDEYILARNALIDKDLIAFDGSLFQVLSLPEKTVLFSPEPLQNQKDMELHDPATVHHLVMQSFGKNHDRN
ncbi:MAG: hypothetical protein QNK40_03965 [Desulfobacterales bacterium]|nr:hypothetical protein [Desulfobacterales bacterium]